MNVITIESEAYKNIMNRIDKLEEKFADIVKMAKLPLGEKWLDNQEMCLELNISKRTLQYYREERLIPYVMIKHKIYYRATDVVKFMMSNYVQARKMREGGSL